MEGVTGERGVCSWEGPACNSFWTVMALRTCLAKQLPKLSVRIRRPPQVPHYIISPPSVLPVCVPFSIIPQTRSPQRGLPGTASTQTPSLHINIPLHPISVSAPSLINPRPSRPYPSPPPLPLQMPVSPIFRRDRDQDALAITLAASDMSLADHSPLMSFDDSHPYDYGLSDSTHMIFDFDDVSNYDSKSPLSSWDNPNTADYTMSSTIPLFPASPESATSELGTLSSATLSPNDRSFDPGLLLAYNEVPPATPEYHASALYSS